ncbi:hypothetical protein GW952_32305 (plasmid) [Klebsiella michiganensis]|uniref:Uncharacterized protein n=1 Tax=Klebsiella michiganensis TaxID=1134687 RepID=A0A6P1V804_9ENTR|nr:hypothetical protein [Klebsiella michiganensis]QHS50262.1 hypothetical protein GW952_32305 [Klebsiella michiganensis]HDX8940902.1 hypothetical protein [Klebsiella michiganensis]
MNRLNVLVAGMLMVVATGFFSWRAGREAHADHTREQAANRRVKAESAVRQAELKAGSARESGRVTDRILIREVVKYVRSPNHGVCRFDDAAVQLRQRAIDAAGSLPGFDEPAVPARESGAKQR